MNLIPGRLKVELVEDASEWKRWWSMRWIIATAICSAVIVAYGTLPSDWLPYLPVDVKKWLGLSTLISSGMAALSRVTKQKPKGGE